MDSHVFSFSHRSREPLTRPELALCLLADIAYEHDEHLRPHLPLLVHCAVVLMDSAEPFVYEHCQQLLINLLNSLSARHLEIHHATGAMLSQYRQVSREGVCVVVLNQYGQVSRDGVCVVKLNQYGQVIRDGG